MEYQNVQQRATCPLCNGPLVRKVVGETGRRAEWKSCLFCGADFSPWPERQWCEPDSEPDLPKPRKPEMALVRMNNTPESGPSLSVGARVEFPERLPEGGLLFLIGEWSGNEWEFWARDSWEVTWGRVPSTCERIEKAERLARDTYSRAA